MAGTGLAPRSARHHCLVLQTACLCQIASLFLEPRFQVATVLGPEDLHYRGIDSSCSLVQSVADEPAVSACVAALSPEDPNLEMLSMSAQNPHLVAPSNAKQPQKVSEAPMGDNQVPDMARPDGLHGSHSGLPDSSGTSSSKPPGSVTYPTKAAREALFGVGPEQVTSTGAGTYALRSYGPSQQLYEHDKVFCHHSLLFCKSPAATNCHFNLHCCDMHHHGTKSEKCMPECIGSMHAAEPS